MQWVDQSPLLDQGEAVPLDPELRCEIYYNEGPSGGEDVVMRS
jgi:hypothetical protein